MPVRPIKWTSKTTGEVTEGYQAAYTDQDGKRRTRNFDKSKPAEKWLRDRLNELDEGTHVAASKSITIQQAGVNWLDQKNLDQIEATSYGYYETHLRLHIYPTMGGIKLPALRRTDVVSFAKHLQAKLSKSMAVKVLKTFKMLLNNAIRDGNIHTNVAMLVDIAGSSRDDQEMVFPTKADVYALFNAAEGRTKALILTAAMAGLRASESRGLKWSNINFDRSTITVQQRADKAAKMGAPKSKAGRRTVPMSPLLAATLLEWRKTCSVGPLDLVFPNTAGKTAGGIANHNNWLAQHWHPLQVKLGWGTPSGRYRQVAKKGPDGKSVKDAAGKLIYVDKLDRHGRKIEIIEGRYRFHDLRHFYASMIIEQGFSPKKCQTMLGHASIQQTYDRYGHLFESHEADSAKMLLAETAIFGATNLRQNIQNPQNA